MAKPLDYLKSSSTGKTMVVVRHAIYQDGSQGPFRCDHCEYFRAPTTCTNPEIIKLRDGKVTPSSCCDYFEKDEG